MSDLRGPVLVTGAAGFIGQRVVARLLERNTEVHALLLPNESAPPGWEGRVALLRGDVCDEASVQKAVAGKKTVFHLAALVAEAGSDYPAHWAVTAEGSRNVYRAASAAKARVVVTTSICAYGDLIQREVCREDSPRGQFQGPYGRAKQGQEDFALEAFEKDGLAVSIVRPSNVYGIGSKPWVDMLSAMIRSGGMVVIGDEGENAGLVHVENLVDALLLVAASDTAIGRIYNVCDELDVSWRRYMDDIAAIVGVDAPGSAPRGPLFAAARANEDPASLQGAKQEGTLPLEFLNLLGSDNRFDTARIRSELGWTPRVSYDQALAEISAHLKSL